MKRFDVYAIKDLEKGSFAFPFFVPEGTDVKDVIIDFKRDLQKGVMQLFLDASNYELWFLCEYLDNGDFLIADGHCLDAREKHLVIAGADLTGIKHREDTKITVDLEDGKSNQN